jgi:hypothetical protein
VITLRSGSAKLSLVFGTGILTEAGAQGMKISRSVSPGKLHVLALHGKLLSSVTAGDGASGNNQKKGKKEPLQNESLVARSLLPSFLRILLQPSQYDLFSCTAWFQTFKLLLTDWLASGWVIRHSPGGERIQICTPVVGNDSRTTRNT